MTQSQSPLAPDSSRRAFLRTSALLTASGLLAHLPLSRGVHAAADTRIRIGLIGCGGRGTEAALNALNAGPDVQLVALADIFRERLDQCLTSLRAARPNQVSVAPDRCFVGFDAYQHLISSGVDVVLITPASHFIPTMLKAAIDAGKHVFCEKPHGIDMPGFHAVRAACETARQKGLSVVSGLCWRYAPGLRETMKRVHDGAIGDIVAIQENYLGAPYIVRPRRAGQTELEYQMWNWYHFNWLSGDQTAQQLIHSLDKASWALGDRPPLKAWGLGGRQTCIDPCFGDQFDHQAIVFEYENGVRVFGFTRDQTECFNDTSDLILGTKGRCSVIDCRIEGENPWRYEGPRPNMYDVEHQELFESIRTGRPINNGHYMTLSSALAIVAQIACYSGEMIPWADALKSQRSFSLPRYAWDVEPPVKPGPDGHYPTAMQGKAEFDRWRM